MLSDAGDLAQLALGNELEYRVEHRAEDRNVQPAGVVGHVEAGALSLAQPADVAAQCRRRHGEGEPDPGPDLAGAVVDGPVGVPLVEELVVGVGLVGRVEDEHGGGPDGTGEERHDERPKAEEVDNLVAGADLERGVGLHLLIGEAEILLEEGLEEFQIDIGGLQSWRPSALLLLLPLMPAPRPQTSWAICAACVRRLLCSSMHLLHLVLLLLLLPTDKGRRAIVALQQGKCSAPRRNRLHLVPLSLSAQQAQAAVFEYLVWYCPYLPSFNYFNGAPTAPTYIAGTVRPSSERTSASRSRHSESRGPKSIEHPPSGSTRRATA